MTHKRQPRLATNGSLVFVAALLASGPAAAAPPTREPLPKKTMVRVKAASADRTRVVPTGTTARGPASWLDPEQFRRKTQGRLGALTDQAIAVLRRLIRVTEDSDPQKPDYYFRLAEHYREKKVQYMFKARGLDERIYRTESATEKARLRSQQRRHEKAERTWMKKALTEYRHIATHAAFVGYKRMDMVLFNTADLFNKAGRQDLARRFFGQLIRNHPDSKYLADAYLSFAEYYFNNKQVADALKLYQQVSRHRHSPLYGYALYKQGWCWLNLKDPRRALEMFVKVIRHGKGSTTRSRIVLVREARKDAVRAYSHVGRPDRAWPFFQRLGGKHAPRMLQRLARLYQDQGKFLRAISVYHRLIALFPRSKDLCTWQYRVLRATLPGKDKKAQASESLRLAALYDTFKARGGVDKTCRGNTEGVLRELATTWHREAQVTRDKETYRLAEGLYRAYLATFPRAADRQTMAYYRAELLFALERWRPAALAYTLVAKSKPTGKLAREAAYAAVVAWRNAHNRQEPGNQAARAGVQAGKVPFSADQRLMMEAFQRYLRLVPTGEERVAVLYRLGRMHYEHNSYHAAVRLFARVVKEHPDHQLAEFAANLLLDSLNIQKKYGELERWVDRLLTDPRLARGGLLKTLDGLKLQVLWKQCEALRRAKKYRQCGQQYAALANRYPNDPRWAEILYNAAQCFEAAKLIGHAISIRMTLIKAKPGHPLAQKALYMVGANYHALAWYSRAAQFYERFARKFPGASEAPAALQNAIIFRLGRQELKEATAAAQLFAKNYGPRRKYAGRTAAVQYSLGVIHEQRGDQVAVVKHYSRYLSRWGRHGGLDRRITAHVKIGKALWRSACPISPVYGACIRVQRQRSRRKVMLTGRGRKRTRVELRTQCGPATKMKVSLVLRARGKARAAQEHFRKALALYTRAGATSIKAASALERRLRSKAMAHAAATARFHQAEALQERFLGLQFPRNLDFSPRGRHRSDRVFLRYLKRKQAGLIAARAAYLDVIKMRDAHWAIAASARVGQLFQNFADALYTAPLPTPPIPKVLVRREDRLAFVETFNEAYCMRLEQVAHPLQDKAEQGLAACLRKSTQLSWYNQWSRLCEAELNQIKPSVYQVAAEIRARPDWVGVKPDRVGLVTAVR